MKQGKFSFPELDPHPDFVMMEAEMLVKWYSEGIVDAYLHRNDNSPEKFAFLDGPITANNPMGVHHGRGRTYKDLWQRYQNMRGKRQRFQNGFDCQGLWVEVEVEKGLGFRSKKDIQSYGVEKFVTKCQERVLKFSAIQTEQSRRLGMFMDWEHSYFTMSAENNYAIWNFLKVCHDRGWIYKGHDSVPWCPRCETAISQHEMLTEDYKLVTHRAIYLELPVIGKKSEFLLVWTTTPWTIPANIAVAVDENLDYALVEGLSGDLFWLAKERVEAVFKPGGYKQVVKTVKGKRLVGLHYRGPFDDLPAVRAVAAASPDKFHLVVATDPQILPVTTSEGTGLVHTAVSAGSEDFKLGQQLGLPIIPVIADDANYIAGLGFLTGKNAKEHPEIILDYLGLGEKQRGENWVFLIEDYSHRYPACWRCQTELVWKVTDEWYISMDKHPSRTQNSKLKTQNLQTLREQIKTVAKKINWIPKFGLERELDWLTNMHDWLISKKNRFWGLALPIYECASCGWFDVIGSEAELKKRAVSGWDKFEGHTPHKPWIDEVKIKCAQCGQLVSRIEPVGNPWLDAGIVPFSTLPSSWFPADFITESFPGQFKNWFYSLLVMSTVLRGAPPFKTVLGFESVTGEDGRPMHKSWGNMIEFNEGAQKIGVDVMRWMYAKTAPTAVLPFGYKTGDEIRRRFMLILWNSFRFFISQAGSDGWTPKFKSSGAAGSGSARENLNPNCDHILDRWILQRLSQTVDMVTKSLGEYQSAGATAALEQFVNDFSTWYIRRSRDRVGPGATDDDDKQAAYRTMFIVLQVLSRLLAPIMPYLSDYIYQALTGEKSVHLADWPVSAKLRRSLKIARPDQGLADRMQFVREITQLGHSQRQAANINLRQPLAAVKISSESIALGEEFTKLIKDELNVKKVAFTARSSANLVVSIDTHLTDELLAEGRARQIIRMIQQKRREVGVGISDKIMVFLPQWPANYAETIKTETLALSLKKHPELKIKLVDS